MTMSIEVKLDSTQSSGSDIKIIKVLKNLGDAINEEDIIFEIESEKGASSVKAKAKGIIESINVKEGESVPANSVLALVKGEKAAEGKEALNTFSYFGNLIKPAKVELECDIAIIGGGPGGYVAAIHAAKKGAKVVLIEKENLGGTCLNLGCIPTKALVRSAQVYDTLKNSEEFGCCAENVTLKMDKVIKRKEKVVAQLVQGINFLMNKNNIKVIKGTGEIINNKTVMAKSSTQEAIIKANNIIIATGSKTAEIPVKGAKLKNVITSNEALQLKEVPKKLVIVGGGVIGMEFAYIYSTFGAEVSVIEFMNECLAMCDDDICAENKRNAAKKGIKLYTSAKVEEILEADNGECIIRFTHDNMDKYITADKVLLAVGRTPVIEGLGIEKAGIELNENKKGIKVNDKMESNIPNIYAIGDVTNKMLLAHVASHQGIVAVENIMGRSAEMDYNAVPSAIFTDPEIAIVGIGEKAAKEQGIEVEVGKFPFSANGKALTFGESSGFIKVIKEKATGKILGAAIVGLHATDLISELTLAVKKGLTAEDIIETIHAHPTTAEVIHEAALSAEGGAIHFA